jgi:hypothetical protein
MTYAKKTAAAVAVMAAGVLVISAAYAVGRAGLGGAAHDAAVAGYWLGEALIFAGPAALALGSTRPAEVPAAWLAVALGLATYLVKYLYSPAAFQFSDEFLHLRTLTALQGSHHLFGVNYALPVSPGFPGIEVATSALTDLTGLPVFPAGLIVAGLAHLVFTAAIYTLFRLVGDSARIGLAAVTVYATSPHYQVFDAIFGYQTLALAFFALALLALRIATRPGNTRARAVTAWLLAAVFAAATAVTHHVTSYVLVGTAAVIAAAALFTRDARATGDARAAGGQNTARGERAVKRWYAATNWRSFAGPACFAAGSAALVALWTGLVVPGTVSYLSPAVSQLTDGVRSALSGHVATSAGAAPLPTPLGDRAASIAAAVLIMVVIPFGWWQIWRTQRDNAWALALGAGAALYYPCVALPFVTADGSELAGRLLTFVYIPVGYTLAAALVARPPAPRRKVVAAGAAALLVAGGISMGWPPWWERLPGSYVVDGFESGVNAESLAAASWAAAELPPGQRLAADYTNNLLLGTLGGQNPVNGVTALFCGGTWTLADALIARQQAVRYLVVDLRTSQSRAPDGSLFAEASSCPTPIPRADLSKFDAVHGMTRVYDSGNIIVYALSEAAYAP